MKAFAELLDRLNYTPSRNGKLALMRGYFRATPDPDRGYALAVLTDMLRFSFPVRKTVLALAADHIDAEIFKLSRDYVGDTAETLSLIWPDVKQGQVPRLSEVMNTLALANSSTIKDILKIWLDALDVNGRWAILKIVTGGLRSGVSSRLAKTALAQAFDKSVDEIEQLWHGLTPPYVELFHWLEGSSAKPEIGDVPIFRPVMLSHPLEEADLAALDVSDYQIEWKWDGIRVQICARGDQIRIYTRTGEDISHGFPEFQILRFNATLDGELLISRDGILAPFQDLQQRLNRKTVSKKMMEDYPPLIRLYDALDIDGEDLRKLPIDERRLRLEQWHLKWHSPFTGLSEILKVKDRDQLSAIWSSTRSDSIEGLMLKRHDSAYVSGRPRGLWWKWKRSALTADCVMIYAQRGSGKRSSFYSDFTFAAWDETKSPRELVPVGKAYSGFTDEELKKLDHYVRHHTTQKFGPVRQVEPTIVLEIAFDGVQNSTRHKSGIALRFPRISRIRWDKPASEADTLASMALHIPINEGTVHSGKV